MPELFCYHVLKALSTLKQRYSHTEIFDPTGGHFLQLALHSQSQICYLHASRGEQIGPMCEEPISHLQVSFQVEHTTIVAACTACPDYSHGSARVSALALHSPQAGWRSSRLGLPLVWCGRLNCQGVNWTLQLLLQSGIHHGMLLNQTFAFKCSRNHSHPEMRLRPFGNTVHVAFIFHHELLRIESLLQLRHYLCFGRSTRRRPCGIACSAERQQTTSGQ